MAHPQSVGRLRRAPARDLGLDAIRGFAVFAMVVAHTATFLQPVPRVVALAEALLNNVAAPLFALVIGLTITVAGPPASATFAVRRTYRRQTLVKAAALIGMGLLLDLRFSGVVIVLAHLGMSLLLALPFLFARTRTLFVWAAGLLLASPGLVTGARVLQARLFAAGVSIPPAPRAVLDWLVLGYSYQALNLLPLILLGVALSRTVAGRPRALALLFLGCLPVTLVMNLWTLFGLVGSDVRGGYVEVWREAPAALAAATLILLLVEHAPAGVRRVARPTVEPLAAMGRMALSVYVLHVLILMGVHAAAAGLDGGSGALRGPARGLAIQAGLVMICWAFAAGWWRWLGTGPVERLLGAVSGRHPSASPDVSLRTAAQGATDRRANPSDRRRWLRGTRPHATPPRPDATAIATRVDPAKGSWRLKT